jgi:hypothetical protein
LRLGGRRACFGYQSRCIPRSALQDCDGSKTGTQLQRDRWVKDLVRRADTLRFGAKLWDHFSHEGIAPHGLAGQPVQQNAALCQVALRSNDGLLRGGKR